MTLRPFNKVQGRPEVFEGRQAQGHVEENRNMKKNTFLIFIAYIWTKTLLGITFHPFSTIRQVTRRPVLLPIIFSPFIGLILFFIVGRIGAFLISVYGLKREVTALFLSTTLISILLWQTLLIYLLVSFLVALWKK